MKNDSGGDKSDEQNTTLVSSASGAELADACAVVGAVRMAENNGGALAELLSYRFRVRKEALDTKGIPPDMLLVSKEIFDSLSSPSHVAPHGKGDRTPEPEHADIPAAYWTDLWALHTGIHGDGEYAYEWQDKPHRMVYRLTAMLAAERAARSATAPSKAEAYRRAFVLLLAEVLASGWFHNDPGMRAKVVAYLHAAKLDEEHFTVEKVLHDAMGVPTDAERAFVATDGGVDNG